MTAFAQPAAGWVRPPLEGIAGELATSIAATIKQAAKHAPRSVQTAPGPSEIGTPCTRKLAYKTLDWDPKPNSDTDPWAATVGTSIHAWMAATYDQVNQQLGRERYLIEHRVHLPWQISGTCDLYDRDLRVSLDWKTTSSDRLKKYRRDGPGHQYRTQIHLYGLGMLLAGEHPEKVAIVFLPRGGRTDDLHVWAEPFNPVIAADAIKRLGATSTALVTLDPEAYPDRWAMFPTADAYCTYCPWHLPGSADLSKGCPGHNPSKETK
jgi:hypothetical protein